MSQRFNGIAVDRVRGRAECEEEELTTGSNVDILPRVSCKDSKIENSQVREVVKYDSRRG